MNVIYELNSQFNIFADLQKKNHKSIWDFCGWKKNLQDMCNIDPKTPMCGTLNIINSIHRSVNL